MCEKIRGGVTNSHTVHLCDKCFHFLVASKGRGEVTFEVVGAIGRQYAKFDLPHAGTPADPHRMQSMIYREQEKSRSESEVMIDRLVSDLQAA